MAGLKAPFPWFGGKRRVANIVWEALGDVDMYIEPFFGSGAVLLGRPHEGRRIENINDADGYVANFWRAIAHDPDAVAKYADYPVNETDLLSRQIWLVETGRSRLLEGMESDPEWFDPQIAGWWVWGLSTWIGAGWCNGDGPWMNAGDGTVRKRPHEGLGARRKLPLIGNSGMGIHRKTMTSEGIYDTFRTLQERFRYVRVSNGDWSRQVTRGVLSYGKSIGIFLDPPYKGDIRYADIYVVEDHSISGEVREWCLEHGDNPKLKIVLAGYTDEHDDIFPDTWRRHYYSGSASYSTTKTAKNKTGNHQNRHKECLWFSPHCLKPEGEEFSFDKKGQGVLL